MFEGINALVTGHTGFKGAWLALWLQQLGARVIGYSLPAPTQPSLFELANVSRGIVHTIGDLRDYKALHDLIAKEQPDIIFHLAAQSLVLDAFEQPKETFDINVGGTVNVLEAARETPSVQGVVVVTTDKCYENQGWCWGYRENDRLGGSEPYSGSKAMAELAVSCYRPCFPADKQLATVRAGNVIGGGDFSARRLFPDIMRSLMDSQPLLLRQPDSVRPWLYVLDALHGYLLVAKELLEKKLEAAEAWNFGPLEQVGISVCQVVEEAIGCWGSGCCRHLSAAYAGKEMPFLRLNWEKAAQKLKWSPQYSWKEAVAATVAWYQAYHKGKSMYNFCLDHISEYQRKIECDITPRRYLVPTSLR